MNTQPEALRLADMQDAGCFEEWHNTAAELRRLHAVEQDREVLAGKYLAQIDERDRLHALNQELLVALDWIAKRCAAPLIDWPLHNIHREAAHDAGACARAAIAKAGEQK